MLLVIVEANLFRRKINQEEHKCPRQIDSYYKKKEKNLVWFILVKCSFKMVSFITNDHHGRQKGHVSTANFFVAYLSKKWAYAKEAAETERHVY